MRRNAMRRLWIWLALMVAAGPASALDLAGYTLGQPLTQDERGALVRHGAGGGACDETTCRGLVYLGDITATAVLTLDQSSRIEMIHVVADHAEFRALRDAAREKYGKPASISSAIAENMFGATFRNVSIMWLRGNDVVWLTERCGGVESSCISATTRAFLAHQPKPHVRL